MTETMTRPGRPSTIEGHERRAEIEAALARNTPLRAIATEYGVSVTALHRHRTIMVAQETEQAAPSWCVCCQHLSRDQLADLDRALTNPISLPDVGRLAGYYHLEPWMVEAHRGHLRWPSGPPAPDAAPAAPPPPEPTPEAARAAAIAELAADRSALVRARAELTAAYNGAVRRIAGTAYLQRLQLERELAGALTIARRSIGQGDQATQLAATRAAIRLFNAAPGSMQRAAAGH